MACTIYGIKHSTSTLAFVSSAGVPLDQGDSWQWSLARLTPHQYPHPQHVCASLLILPADKPCSDHSQSMLVRQVEGGPHRNTVVLGTLDRNHIVAAGA